MASRPKWRAFERAINRAGGIEAITDLVVDGMTVKAIAATFKGSRQLVYKYVNDPKHPDRRPLFRKAREDSADALAEDALDILDAGQDDAVGVQRAKHRADHRRWLAGLRNRADFGTKADVGVNQLNIGELHLHALQGAQRVALPAPAADIVDADFTVEEPTDA